MLDWEELRYLYYQEINLPVAMYFYSICMHPTTNLGPIRSIFSISTQELKCLYISVEIDRLGFKCL